MSKPRKRRAKAPETNIITTPEWHAMRLRGDAPAHMMPLKKVLPARAVLPDNVVRFTVILRHALYCRRVMRAHMSWSESPDAA
jgi:hypothetical protein